MTKKIDVLTIGSAVRDVIFYTSEGKVIKTPQNLTAQKMWAFEYGAKIEIDSCCNTLGGGGLNKAYNFKVLGLKVAPIIRMGNDVDGQWVRQSIRSHGIDGSLIQVDKNEHTGFTFIMCNAKKDHDHIIYVHRGANNNLEINQKSLNTIKAKWIFINSLTGKSWYSVLEKIFDYAKKSNTKVAWNPGGQQIAGGKKRIEKFLKQTDVLQLNKDEAIELVLSGIKIGKRDPKFVNKHVYLLNMINEWGPKVVTVTLGSKGATAIKNGKVYFQKAPKRKVVDTTGVGDAFGAGFVAQMIHEKDDINRALLWGILNASGVVTEVGAHNGVVPNDELIKMVNKAYAR